MGKGGDPPAWNGQRSRFGIDVQEFLQESLLARGAAGLSTADIAGVVQGRGGLSDCRLGRWLADGTGWRVWLRELLQESKADEDECRGKVCGCLCSPKLDSVFGVPRTWWWCLSAGESFSREEKRSVSQGLPSPFQGAEPKVTLDRGPYQEET